jgi:methylenetetrahydrofolate reductase (NADPH)
MTRQSLRQLLFETDRFLIGTEVVTSRGILADEGNQAVARFALAAAEHPNVDFVNVTDNPGGNPMFLPEGFGTALLERGANVVIHLTGKDTNRNGIEARAWNLANLGFENVLAMTGDYPVDGFRGLSRPVFDVDSVAILSLLDEMNQGMRVPGKKGIWNRLRSTQFLLAAAVSPFKQNESELLPQYLKLEKKIESGAKFIFSQVGYDCRKFHEIVLYCGMKGWKIPLVYNVYVLSGFVAKLFNAGKIPGCVVNDNLRDLCLEAAKSEDKGKRFFGELAAKQVAVARGLGYRGAYIGGVSKIEDIGTILEIEKGFGPDDWKTFAREIQYPQPNEFYLFAKDPDTGLSRGEEFSPEYESSLTERGRKSVRPTGLLMYRVNRAFHDHFFDPDSLGYKVNKTFYKWLDKQGGLAERFFHYWETMIKIHLFDCKDCGDCSLPETAYLCPMSQCAKNQRNGPCGGSKQGKCEVEETKQCVWARAYERLKRYHEEETLLDHAPTFTNWDLEETSGWKNYYLERDHASKTNVLPEVDPNSRS